MRKSAPTIVQGDHVQPPADWYSPAPRPIAVVTRVNQRARVGYRYEGSRLTREPNPSIADYLNAEFLEPVYLPSEDETYYDEAGWAEEFTLVVQ